MKRKTRMKSSIPTLPEDVYFEILSRLPVKSLLRFCCASKLWGSLIDEPYFISTHLKQFQNNKENSRLLALEPPMIGNGKQFCVIRRGDTFRKMSRVDLDISWCQNYQVVGSINGVFCMKKNTMESLIARFFLWNPSIKKLVDLPLPELASKGTKKVDVDFAFEFDMIRNDYKIVASLYARGEIHISQFVELYSLKERSWKSINIGHAPCLWSKGGPKTFLNGVTYWVGNELIETSSQKGRYSHFVSFDASNDAFNYIELPHYENVNAWEHQRFPVVLDQAIALMEVFRTHSYIWVMEESGVTNSWIRRYSINFELQHRFLHLKTNGELLFRGAQGVRSYNLESQETKILAKSYRITPAFTDIYMESLALLKEKRLQYHCAENFFHVTF